MEVKELFLDLSAAEKIFDLMQEEITNNENVQIFVENSLIDELRTNGREHQVYTFNGEESFHYDTDSYGTRGEKWYGYHTEQNCSPRYRIASASFINNCRGYYQLVQFPEVKYAHYLVGFENLVVIHKK